jgi:hypothetical protein
VKYATLIKAGYLPINKGMTPEEVIESEFGDFNYKYKIYDDIMFVCIDSSQNGSELKFAFRNDHSGFMFQVPGYFSGSLINGKNKVVYINESLYPIYCFVGKVHSKYYITITDLHNQNTHFYKDGKVMDLLDSESAGQKYWVTVIDDSLTISIRECYL